MTLEQEFLFIHYVIKTIVSVHSLPTQKLAQLDVLKRN
jgi:hypothetical protein